MEEIVTVVLALVGLVTAGICVPLGYQFVNGVSNKIQESNHAGMLTRKAAMLQAQINDNTAINNTAISGVAGQEETAKVAKAS